MRLCFACCVDWQLMGLVCWKSLDPLPQLSVTDDVIPRILIALASLLLDPLLMITLLEASGLVSVYRVLKKVWRNDLLHNPVIAASFVNLGNHKCIFLHNDVLLSWKLSTKITMIIYSAFHLIHCVIMYFSHSLRFCFFILSPVMKRICFAPAR